MSKVNHPTRREFLKQAGVAFAVPYVITSKALGAADGTPPASERIVMGGIGLGSQGGNDQNDFLRRREVQYVAVCDVRQSVRESKRARVNQQYGNDDCLAYNDFRELVAREDIDAVHIATPDHWHALMVIEACRNGKDVYCQKPETLTIKEGRAMVQAARRYGCVVSGGSQRVMDDTGRLALRCWNGEFGVIKEACISCGPPSTQCYLPGVDSVDPDVDWDMWLGPAPWAPYHPYRMSGSYSINGTSWRSWRDYSGGGMTDWGAHRMGSIMFALDIMDQGPVEVIPPDGKDVRLLTYVFKNGLKINHTTNDGGLRAQNAQVMQGIAIIPNPDEPKEAKPMPQYKSAPGSGGRSSIHGDFLYCVRTREKPFRDIEYAHRTATCCHLGCIAYELNRPLKWDADKEEFPGDEEANRFLDRPKREPWII
jgi:hypothetical protein